MKIQSSEPKYIPAITMNRTTGELQDTKVNWTELMEKAKKTATLFRAAACTAPLLTRLPQAG